MYSAVESTDQGSSGRGQQQQQQGASAPATTQSSSVGGSQQQPQQQPQQQQQQRPQHSRNVQVMHFPPVQILMGGRPDAAGQQGSGGGSVPNFPFPFPPMFLM